MNIDLFNNYILQREELLARIAQQLQLDETRKERMQSAYNSVSKLLENDEAFFKYLDFEVYPHGSFAIGTTVKPYSNNEFDLDICLHLLKLYSLYSPFKVYSELLRVLKGDGRYKDILEEKNRCIRLNYANDFHMDITPGCLILPGNLIDIKVPDKRLRDLVDSSPKGFINWFQKKSKILVPSLLEDYRRQLIDLKAEIQNLPLDEYYKKTPLQRSVQLIKRYRDVFFNKDGTYATSSIIITTIAGEFYSGENSIFNSIDNIINRVKEAFEKSRIVGNRFKIFNPINSQEEFTDKWTSNHYDAFYRFISDFHKKWNSLKNQFEYSNQDYITLFGEGIYKKALQDQVAQMSRFSSNKNAVANGLILNGNAYTDNKGQINSNTGVKNEYHRNYGG